MKLISNKFIKLNKVRISSKYKFLVSYQCHFNVDFYKPELYDFHDIDFPKTIKTSVTKRQAEFLAGRILASKVMSELELEGIQIPIGENRSPVWPVNISASISHTSDTAICIAGFKNDTVGVGIDIEKWLLDNTVNEIKSLIINNNEIHILKSRSIEFSKIFTIVYSAKESLFKALFSFIGFYFDFKDVELISFSLNNCSFEFRLLTKLSNEYQSGFRIKGIYIEDENTVKTLIVL